MPNTEPDDGPRTARGRLTAARLREAARVVFAASSYTTSRVEDVTERAGVSHGTFYTYYANRAAILDALVDEITVRIHEVLDRPWQGDDLETTVRAVIADFVTALRDEAEVIAAWADAAATDPHFRVRWEQLREGFRDRVALPLRPVLVDTVHDPDVVAGALVAMVEGYATGRLADADDATQENAIDTLTAIWVGGLRSLLR